MRLPLWLQADPPGGAELTLTLARCRNCGKPKATSGPCSLDHLAALMELGDALRKGS